jgi:hypothetical protein
MVNLLRVSGAVEYNCAQFSRDARGVRFRMKMKIRKIIKSKIRSRRRIPSI